MSSLLLVTALLVNYLVAASENRLKTTGTDAFNKHNAGITAVSKNNVASHYNITYIDKAENMLRTPNIKNYYEEVEKRKKKKVSKKAPKRTIQKIIKKHRAKLRKIYFRQKQSETTQPSKIDYDKFYAQEEKKWREPTTQATQKKRSRKYSPRVAGYHMPFQKLQPMKDKRYKRGGLSRELYILKDLDEIEFLSKEGDDDVVKAHVKTFW